MELTTIGNVRKYVNGVPRLYYVVKISSIPVEVNLIKKAFMASTADPELHKLAVTATMTEDAICLGEVS